MKTEINFGDTVKISVLAPAKWMPGSEGSVISIYVVENTSYAEQHGVQIGDRMIGVEEGDGTTFEVPETYVEVLQ